MIVSNATPLIAFAKINQLSLLQKIVGNLVIPAAVAREISTYPVGKSGFIDLQQETWINVRSLASEQPVNLLLPILDRGEAETIALGLEEQAKLVLIDELSGRKVAQALNLNISGAVGILILAKQVGEIAAVKPLIEAMRHQGI
jgi:uncharacterized protein